MNTKRYVAYRLLWTIIGAWAALTAIFLAFAATPDPEQYNIFNGLSKDEYRAMRNYDAPLHERYLAWLERFVTFDFGTTIWGEPITSALADAATVTLVYLVPSVVVALGIGVGVGILGAMNRGGVVGRIVRAVSYAGFAVPTFFAADAMFFIAEEHFSAFGLGYDAEFGVFAVSNLKALALPASVLTVNLLAVQLRYARSESTEVLQQEFVRTLRANGAGVASIFRHVLRNAASSLLSLFVSELVGVMFVVIVVIEVIFGVPGFGALLYDGIQNRDVGIILTTTTLPILLVMFGNLVQDVAYTILDPRVGDE